jgi:RNase H-fold protein (predicted Holliday junction resolvase)
MPNVACFSGLSLFCIWCPILPVSLKDTKQRQSRETGNIGHQIQNKDNPEKQATLDTRYKTKTIQRNRQHWTQDTKQRQSRETGNIGHKTQNKDNPEKQVILGTRYKTKTIQRNR